MTSFAFLASDAPEARAAAAELTAQYGVAEPADADVIVALGGDGLMLQALHEFMDTDKPIYGMNRGSVGFLMNEYHKDDLLERIGRSKQETIHPLSMAAETLNGERPTALAINEVSLFRQSHQAAKLQIEIDGQVRLEELSCDGILLSTPAGSTAYNLSAHGPIIPINAPLLALTPISAFRPRRWRGALLPNTSVVRIDILEPDKRPVNAVADHTEFKAVNSVEIREDQNRSCLMLFDADHSWNDRILNEQFRY